MSEMSRSTPASEAETQVRETQKREQKRLRAKKKLVFYNPWADEALRGCPAIASDVGSAWRFSSERWLDETLRLVATLHGTKTRAPELDEFERSAFFMQLSCGLLAAADEARGDAAAYAVAQALDLLGGRCDSLARIAAGWSDFRSALARDRKRDGVEWLAVYGMGFAFERGLSLWRVASREMRRELGMLAALVSEDGPGIALRESLDRLASLCSAGEYGDGRDWLIRRALNHHGLCGAPCESAPRFSLAKAMRAEERRRALPSGNAPAREVA
jgi:hypothetical protein